jgi:hypothetical protein
LLPWAKSRSAPAPPVSVSLPLPPAVTVTRAVPLSCPSLTVTVTVAVPLRPSTAVINRFPGYVSANIHRSLDGTKVVNYAQWRRVEDYEAMLAEPSVQQHISRAAAAAISFEPHLHRVEFTDQASQGPAASPRRR